MRESERDEEEEDESFDGLENTNQSFEFMPPEASYGQQSFVDTSNDAQYHQQSFIDPSMQDLTFQGMQIFPTRPPAIDMGQQFPQFQYQDTSSSNVYGYPQIAQPSTQLFRNFASQPATQYQLGSAYAIQQSQSAVQHHELAAAPSRNSTALPPHPADLADHARTYSFDSASAMLSPKLEPAAPTGPASKAVVVPARPKPGRKPMPPNEASDRRRTQNRMAQRNFRDKRQQKVAELNDEIAGLNEQLKEKTGELHRALQSMKVQMLEAERSFAAERESFNAQIADLTAALQGRHQTFSGPKLPAITTQHDLKPQEVAIPTPPDDNWNEIDMADVWNRSKPTQHSESYTYDMDTDPISGADCGFCTDDSNCACRASIIAAAPKQTPSGPGTCDMCQQDPARAAACRSLADKTQPSTTAAPTESNTKTMSCGQFIDKFNDDHGRMPSIAELFGPLHSFPARNGFNVDEQEAAKVLQGMSTNPPVRH